MKFSLLFKKFVNQVEKVYSCRTLSLKIKITSVNGVAKHNVTVLIYKM